MSTEIAKGSEVVTRFGWSGVVESIDPRADRADGPDPIAFVTDTDEHGRLLNSGWERVASLKVVTADSIVIPEAK